MALESQDVVAKSTTGLFWAMAHKVVITRMTANIQRVILIGPRGREGSVGCLALLGGLDERDGNWRRGLRGVEKGVREGRRGRSALIKFNIDGESVHQLLALFVEKPPRNTLSKRAKPLRTVAAI
ncbi:hypothetical protein Trydic_g20345 [Trypoxylus dichotomus]